MMVVVGPSAVVLLYVLYTVAPVLGVVVDTMMSVEVLYAVSALPGKMGLVLAVVLHVVMMMVCGGSFKVD